MWSLIHNSNTDKKKRKDFPIVSRTAKLRKNAAYYT